MESQVFGVGNSNMNHKSLYEGQNGFTGVFRPAFQRLNRGAHNLGKVTEVLGQLSGSLFCLTGQ